MSAELSNIRPLPSASFTNAIKHTTITWGLRGVGVMAEGTAELLVGAGVCSRDHLPFGRSRIRRSDSTPSDHPVEDWSVERLRGGRLRVRANLRNDEALHRRIKAAKRQLEIETQPDVLERRKAELQRCIGNPEEKDPYALIFGGVFGEMSKLRDLADARGIALDEFSAARLRAICDQIEAAAESAAELLGNARLVVEAGARKAYIDSLEAQCSIPMPALPRVRRPPGWRVIEGQRPA